MKKSIRARTAMALLCASSGLLLQACGGGGDSSGPAADPGTAGGSASSSTPTLANSGSVSANFSMSTRARYQMVGVGSQRFGGLNSLNQSNGAVTKINDSVLSGQSVVQSINGDQTYAMGRWVAGTVTTPSGAETLTGSDTRSYHYVIFNALETFPASGSFSCDTGTFTTPSRDGGSTAAASTGSTSGNASLSFTAGGAMVAGALNVSAGGASGSVALQANNLNPGSNAITGSYLSNGAGAAIHVADAGTGAYEVVGSYRAKTADGTGYIGVYRFRCQ